MNLVILIFLISFSPTTSSKKIALSFDDAPMPTTQHFETLARTDKLIKNLKLLKVPSVMVFANPCKSEDLAKVVGQLKKYRDAGNFIGNHTCSHPRLDSVGFAEFEKDAKKADQILLPLFVGQKFFRFPYLDEGKDQKTRNQVREWLKQNHYRNGMVSIDNDDYLFSFKVNQAKEKGKKIDYKKVQKLFIQHLVGAVNFYDNLAAKTLGYSPKHVILLHEMDATVLFVRPLIEELRKQGWKLISVLDAYKDKIYQEIPINTYANNGIIAQVVLEKTGEIVSYNQFDHLKSELNKILELE